MSNFFSPVYLFHAKNISFSYTIDMNLRVLHISFFQAYFTFSSNWYLVYLFTLRMLPSASAFAGILLFCSCLLFPWLFTFFKNWKHVYLFSRCEYYRYIQFHHRQEIHSSSCLFSCLYTFFMDWYCINLFHSHNVSFYNSICRNFMFLHSCLFFRGLVHCLPFSLD